MEPIRAEIRDLIFRMTEGEDYVEAMMPYGEVVRTNKGSVQWNATREAEKLTDVSIAIELASELSNKIDAKVHGAICFIIAKIGENSRNSICATILIQRLLTTKKQAHIHDVLRNLGNVPKPTEVDLTPIIALLKHKSKSIQDEAVNALRHTDHSEIEDTLIDFGRQTADRFLRSSVHSVLSEIGTEKSLPLLEDGARSRSSDIESSAQSAIEEIRKRSAANG